MESWEKGRGELFDEFNKICNRIGANIAAECNHENIALISKEELMLLRENSDRAEKLAEHNTKLVNELEKAREAAKMVERLERENQRLAGELQRGFQERQSSKPSALAGNSGTANTPRSNTPVATSKPLTAKDLRNKPPSSESPSSTIAIIDDESASVNRGSHQELAAKRNKYFEAYQNAKGAKEIVEERLKEEKKKTKEWSLYADNLDRSNAKKYEKIKVLRSRIQELEGLLNEKEKPIMMGIGEDDPSTPLLDGEVPQLLTKIADNERMGGKEDAQKLKGHGRVEEIPEKREVVADTDEESSDEHALQGEVSKEAPKTIPVASTPMPTATSPGNVLASPVASSRRDETIVNAITQSTDAARGTTLLDEIVDKGDVDLPHLDEETMQVQDAEYELIEQCHSSSTQDASDPPENQEHPADENMPINPPSSPESPIFTYARPVKKRKRNQDTSETSRASRIKATRIKVEDLTSSPIGLKAMCFNESVDLDDIGEKVDTPRKQRRLLNLAHQTPRGDSYYPHGGNQNQSQGSTTDATPVHRTPKSKSTRRKKSALQPRSANQLILPRTSDERAAKKSRNATDRAIEELVEDGEIVATGQVAKERADLDRDSRLGDLLSKPSPLKRTLSPLNLGQRNTPRSLPGKSLVISNLTREVDLGYESNATTRIDPLSRGYVATKKLFGDPPKLSPKLFGEDAPGSPDSSRPSSKGMLRPSSKGTPGSSVDSPRTSPKGSSRSSLEPSKAVPFEGIEVATPALSRWKAHKAQTSKTISGLPPRQPLPMSRSDAAPRKRKPRSEMAATEWEMDFEQEPLRARPVQTLTLRDFKINPNYNPGKNYAFQEIVRGNARACLQGCTKPECCGRKFRALAEGTRNPDKPRTEAEEEEDQELLEEFLGGNAYKIRNMSKDEREHTIIQAMTRKMANNSGRHRHVFERRASPPGFWNADFPTTQEEMQYRVQAKERERDLVLQRYQEAMRPSGAYVFRDE